MWNKIDPLEEIAWMEAHVWVQKGSKGGGTIPLRARPLQRRMSLESPAVRLEKDKTVNVKPRQIGSSTWWLANCICKMVKLPGINILWVNMDDDQAREIRAKWDVIWKSVQSSRNSGFPEVKENNDKVFRLENGSRIRFYTAGDEKDKAENVGRGGTFNLAIFCEFAYWSHPQAVLNSLSPALRRSEPSIIIDSTANGVTGRGEVYYEYARRAQEGHPGYTLLFYPWWDDPDYCNILSPEEEAEVEASLTEEEEAIIEQAAAVGKKLTMGHIAWWRDSVLEMKEKVHETYPATFEQAFLKPGKCAFSDKLMRKLIKKVASRSFEPPLPAEQVLAFEDEIQARRDPANPFVRPDLDLLARPKWGASPKQIGAGYCRVWRLPDQAKAPFFAGIDGSKGVDDWQSMTILDRDFELCAILRARVRPTIYAANAQRLLTLYDAWVQVEMEGSGTTILNRILEPVHPSISAKFRTGTILSRPYQRIVGDGFWRTTKYSRPALIELIIDILDNEIVRVPDELFYAEMDEFRDNGDGKIEHAPGSHDDQLFSTGMAAELRQRIIGTAHARSPFPRISLVRVDPRHGYIEPVDEQRLHEHYRARREAEESGSASACLRKVARRRRWSV